MEINVTYKNRIMSDISESESGMKIALGFFPELIVVGIYHHIQSYLGF